LGIGTASPITPLHVQGAATIRGNLDLSGTGPDGSGAGRLIIGGPETTQASIEFYAVSNGKMNLNSFNNNGVNINGPLAVAGGFSFTGSLTLAGGQSILGANGSFFNPYDGITGNLIIRSTTLNDTLSKIRFQVGSAATDRAVIFGNGNFAIGTTTDAGFKLDVNGTARFSNAMTGFTLSLGGGTISATTHLTINGANSAPSGTSMGISNNFTFFPNSGNANATAFSYEGTINQTGTATGITRGLYINPTITAAADFRAIEVARGITILGAATTAKASLRIPSGTAPTSPVNGDIWFDGTDIKMRIGGVTKTFTLI
jgi:hypothetical protein